MKMKQKEKIESLEKELASQRRTLVIILVAATLMLVMVAISGYAVAKVHAQHNEMQGKVEYTYQLARAHDVHIVEIDRKFNRVGTWSKNLSENVLEAFNVVAADIERLEQCCDTNTTLHNMSAN